MNALRAVLAEIPDSLNGAGISFGAVSVLIFLHYFLAGGIS